MTNKTIFLILFIFITTTTGNRIVFADDPDVKRIVSVDSNATEIIIALGMENNIVATDMTSQQLLTTPTIPNLGYHRQLSTEGILVNKPSLIIGSDHMGPATTLTQLQKTGVRLIQLRSPNNIHELIENTKQLGIALSQQQAAGQLIHEIQMLQQSLENIIQTPSPKIAFLLNIGDRGLSLAGEGTTGAALIKLLRGNNISDYSGYKTVSIESLLSINPDVILLAQRGDTANDVDSFTEANPLISQTQAAKNARIIAINANNLIAGISMCSVNTAIELSKTIYQTTP